MKAPGALEQPAPSLAPDQIADVVAHDRPGASKHDHELDLSLPRLASTAAVISAVSPGIGTPLDSPMTRRKSSG